MKSCCEQLSKHKLGQQQINFVALFQWGFGRKTQHKCNNLLDCDSLQMISNRFVYTKNSFFGVLIPTLRAQGERRWGIRAQGERRWGIRALHVLIISDSPAPLSTAPLHYRPELGAGLSRYWHECRGSPLGSAFSARRRPEHLAGVDLELILKRASQTDCKR